jgi:hypothetical protein
LSASTILKAQFNIKVAYSGLYTKLPLTKQYFRIFNTNNDLKQEFASPRYLHGLDIGTCYRYKSWIAEAGWVILQSKKIEAITQTNITHKWNLSTSEFYLGLESRFGMFGVGSSLGYNSIKYKQTPDGSNKKNTVLREPIINTKFYIIIEAKGENNAIAIKPFFQPQWQSLNLNRFSQNLNNINSNDKEYFSGYGISIVIYNGPQMKN